MLILLPNVLEGCDNLLPASLKDIIPSLDGLIAESERGGRLYLKRFKAVKPIKIFSEHTRDLEELLMPVVRGEKWGLISDAGNPCIADPGYKLVAKALEKKIKVEALMGPCSIILALMLSGFSGQSFAFHGYLPREKSLLKNRLLLLEKRAFLEKSTQIWMEAPYRSDKMLEIVLEILHSNVLLSVATNLTLPCQQVITASILEWRKKRERLGKNPTIFMLAPKQ